MGMILYNPTGSYRVVSITHDRLRQQVSSTNEPNEMNEIDQTCGSWFERGAVGPEGEVHSETTATADTLTRAARESDKKKGITFGDLSNTRWGVRVRR